MKTLTNKYWECGVCHITTFGDWECEVKPQGTSDEEFKPVCKFCTIGVKANFVPDEQAQ